MQSAEFLTEISPKLRMILKEIEKYFDISLQDVDQIFTDMEADRVQEKAYELYIENTLQILGRVDEYEPETIWLIFKGLKKSHMQFLTEIF